MRNNRENDYLSSRTKLEVIRYLRDIAEVVFEGVEPKLYWIKTSSVEDFSQKNSEIKLMNVDQFTKYQVREVLTQ